MDDLSARVCMSAARLGGRGNSLVRDSSVDRDTHAGPDLISDEVPQVVHGRLRVTWYPLTRLVPC